MVVENTDYLDAVANLSVIDNVPQNWVFSISWADVFTARSKPGIISQQVKRSRQIVDVFLCLIVTPLRKRIQPNGLHVVSRFRRKPELPFSHACLSLNA